VAKSLQAKTVRGDRRFHIDSHRAYPNEAVVAAIDHLAERVPRECFARETSPVSIVRWRQSSARSVKCAAIWPTMWSSKLLESLGGSRHVRPRPAAH